MILVGVEIYPGGRTTYFFSREIDLEKGDWCLCKIKDTVEMGRIKFIIPAGERALILRRKYLRKATLADREELKCRMEIEKKAHQIALKKILSLKLPMKLVATRYPLRASRITFYYIAKQRVDFRVLVKELAAIFELRIQMQQIGVRDEPQILGGYGICGRQVCCTSFLGKEKERLDSVSLEAARLQNLPLASSKISGVCGRLRCCLNFEYPTYSALKKGLPSVGEVIRWQGEKLKVTGLDILKGTIVVETEERIKKTLTREELTKQR